MSRTRTRSLYSKVQWLTNYATTGDSLLQIEVFDFSYVATTQILHNT